MRPRTFRHAMQVGLPVLLIVSVLLSTFWPTVGNATISSRSLNTSLNTMQNRSHSSDFMPFGPTEGSSDGSSGLDLVLTGGREIPAQVEAIPLAPAEPLTAAEIEAIYDRLPPLPQDTGDMVDFRLPAETLPRPRTGDVITESFPPPGEPLDPVFDEAGPLEVLRFAPDGEVPLAPFVNVTFNQPMVPLGTIEQLSAQDVPVRLTPEIPGVWKWIGTRSLVFQADDSVDGPSGMDQSQSPRRFPMATEFTVEVPAGTTSATGGELGETVSWTFRTPPPTLRDRYPTFGPQSRNPIIFAAFDQAIDPAAVLATVSLTAGGQEYAVQLATREEISATARLRYQVDAAGDDRWLAFRPTQELPANTTVAVNIGPNTPSAEGPLTTTEVQSFSFQTYGPFRLEGVECGWGGNCPPMQPFYLRFSNPIDFEQFNPDWITVSPEIPGLSVEVFANNIVIQGVTQGQTTYDITIDGALVDTFGQTLGQTQTVSVTTGSAPRSLSGPANTLLTVDPTLETPVYSFYSINYDRLRVRMYAVQPEDWPAYLEYARSYGYDESIFPPGVEVENRIFSIDAATDELLETTLDLSSALNGDTGHLIVVVDFPPAPFSLGRQRERAIISTWVQATQIGLDAFVDHSDMLVWATALRDGTPLADVDLRLLNTTRSTGTDANGLGRLSLPSERTPLLIAQRGNDTAILPHSQYAWYDDGWIANPLYDSSRWYVFDDRALYRPGETVHLKGWIRRVSAGQDGDISLRTGASFISYQVIDPRGNELTRGNADVSNLGGFDFSFDLPEGVNLGDASIYLAAQGGSQNIGGGHYHSIQIQEFRRPEFEVRALNEAQGPFFLGQETTVSVSAQYFAGGSLPNADTTWRVSSQGASYSPPNWPDFTFGRWTPWWFYWMEPAQPSSAPQEYTGATDAAGFHFLNIGFPAAETPQPYTVNAEAVVMDVNRQAWAASTSFLVHPAEIYVGLRTDRTFVNRGDPLDVEAIVTDLDGNALSDVAIEIEAVRLEWKRQGSRWEQVETDPQVCNVTSSTVEPVSCTFETEIGGEYRITATVQDSQGRINETVLTRWVSGGQRPPVRNVEQEEVVLIPDRESYQPGDVAEILVQAPFAPAHGLLSLRRSGIVETIPFTMEDATHVLYVPIEEGYIPNLHIAVDLAGNTPRTDDLGEPRPDLPARPAFGSGTLELSIPPATRTLSVTVQPEVTALEPGATTSLDVTVTDAQGAPVANAEMAIVVVDEAVLALTGYTLQDPLDIFYQSRDAGVSSVYGRSYIVLASPDTLTMQDEVARAAMPMAAPTAGMAFAEESAAMDMAMPAAEMADSDGMAISDDKAGDGSVDDTTPITIRTDFNPLALFAPEVNTDANGRATVEVRVPDNLTRYRIMVVAVEGDNRFGSAETNITARLPLMVRPSAPRFLNFGDSFELPIVLQNQTDEAMTVELAVRAGNLNLVEGAGQRVTIPANDRREVRFPALTQQAGNVRLQIAAVAGSYTDAASVSLPVYTPATSEAFAVYGVVDEGAVIQPILSPQNVWPQFGGLEIATSSTALQALTDSVLYLVSYPFECSEQLASRILAVAALRDVLTAFEAEGLPAPAEIEAAVQRDIQRLADLQNADGGFPVWTRGRESWPFYSIHVAHALHRAADKGFDVPVDMQERVLNHIRQIEQYYPHWYGRNARHALSAYALYVRSLMGDVDTVKARNLLNQFPLEEQSLEAVAWLWQVLSNDRVSAQEIEEIRRHILNRAVETPSAANFTTSYGDDAYLMLHSNRRTDAIILDALIQDEPDSDLIPKVVTGLLAHRSGGHWNNTQENVFVLLAMDRYFNTFESVTPDFIANMWLGDVYAGGHEFEGYTTETRQTQIPMRYLTESDEFGDVQDLVIAKEGDGRLYYRLGLRYAPRSLELEPLEMGFVVQRTYAAVDDDEDVYRDEEGTWHIKAGARVRVTINMVAPSRRYHVALVDPLPAGLEIINPALAVSESVPQDPSADTNRGWWWWGPWYEHQNLRDQRAEAFSTLLWEGVYEYSYVARATTPGEFVAPPAKAEEMYSPEVFGRSGTDRVIVE